MANVIIELNLIYCSKVIIEAMHLFKKDAQNFMKENKMIKIILIIFLYSTVTYGYTEKKQNYRKIFNEYKILANNGDAHAQYYIADMFRTGEGTPKNIQQAFYWHHKSALQGYAPGQSSLGVFYERGIGTKIDIEKALFWYKKAASQNFPLGQYNLGNLYRFNKKYQDYKKAFYWHKKAAEQNMKYSQFRLALMYTYAKGVKKDLNQAKYWTKKALDNNHPEAKKFLKYLNSLKNLNK